MADQLQETSSSPSDSERSHRRWVPPLVFVAGLLAFLLYQAVAWALVAFLLDFPEGTDSEALYAGIWLLLVGVPLAWWWIVGGRRRRWSAAGATAGLVMSLIALGVTLTGSTGDPHAPTPRHDVGDADVPLYYVGPRFRGWPLDAAVIFPDASGESRDSDLSFDRGDDLFLGYGETCEGSSCAPSFEMDVHILDHTDFGGECVRRFVTTRGVTPVETDANGTVFFVGRLVVTFPDQPDPALVDETLRQLRQVGDSRHPGDPPVPTAEVAESIPGTAPCGRPGDEGADPRGPLLERILDPGDDPAAGAGDDPKAPSRTVAASARRCQRRADVGDQLPWNPAGTRAGRCTAATSSSVSASSITRSLVPSALSKT